MTADDRALIDRLQAGDLEALGLLFDRHRMAVFRTALAITRDADVAEDITQDAFLRLHRYADRIDGNLPLMGWMYRVTVNLSYTWVTRAAKWRAPLDELVERWMKSSKRSIESESESHDEWRAVQQAIDSLSFDHKVVVVLYYLNDLSLQEIADILDCPVGTVKSRLHYGREKLKQKLGVGVDLIPEAQYEFTG